MLRALWTLWRLVARKIGHLQSLIVLTVVYFVVIAPFALVVRVFSDPLGLRRGPLWHQLARGEAGVDAARQQF